MIARYENARLCLYSVWPSEVVVVSGWIDHAHTPNRLIRSLKVHVPIQHEDIGVSFEAAEICGVVRFCGTHLPDFVVGTSEVQKPIRREDIRLCFDPARSSKVVEVKYRIRQIRVHPPDGLIGPLEIHIAICDQNIRLCLEQVNVRSFERCCDNQGLSWHLGSLTYTHQHRQ